MNCSSVGKDDKMRKVSPPLNLAGKGREIEIKRALEGFVNSVIDTLIITLCGPNSHLESDPGSVC